MESEDELHDRVRAIDPAADIAPASSDRVARLVEDIMIESPNRDRRNPWVTWVAAAAAVVLLGAVGIAWSNRGGHESPIAGEKPSVTTVTVPSGGTGKCMALNVDVLRAQEFAFAGTVTQLTDNQATLEVSRWYRGEQTDTVVVRAPEVDLQSLLGAVEFVEGKDYLVSGTGSSVTLCGFTGPQSPALATLYDQAYAG